MMKADMEEDLSEKIRELENRLEEAEQLIEAIKNGHVDAFAISMNGATVKYTQLKAVTMLTGY